MLNYFTVQMHLTFNFLRKEKKYTFMWKSDTDNQIQPGGVPPITGQQEKIQYPERHKNTIGKRL